MLEILTIVWILFMCWCWVLLVKKSPSDKKQSKETLIQPRETFMEFVIDPDQLATLYIGFSKGKFKDSSGISIRPNMNFGQAFIESLKNSDDLKLYFSENLYSIFFGKLIETRDKGEFRNSNAEARWEDLIDVFKSAKVSNNEDIESLELYLDPEEYGQWKTADELYGNL